MSKLSKIGIMVLFCIVGVGEGASASELFGGFIGRKACGYAGARFLRSLPANSESLSALTLQSKRFTASASHRKTLYSLVAPSFEKVDGNGLKEIAAYGSEDFVSKSYKLVALLKESFKQENAIEGKDGLADSIADWRVAWADLTPRQKKNLQGSYKKILDIIATADSEFFGINATDK